MKKIIHTALCSFGMSGRLFHAPFIHQHPGFHLHGVWERSRSTVKEYYPDAMSYATLEELLADKETELVIVNTPNYTHHPYAKQALLAGKHVIVEKPFTVTTGEAQELIDLSNRTGKKISVYQNRRYDSDYRTVRKIIASGILGKIVEAEFHFDRYKEELSPKAHKETPGPGTGSLYDLGSHLIDQALQLFGMPQSVFADIQIIRPHSKVDDYFELLFYYPSLRVRIRSSYLVREPIPGYIIHGTNGSFHKGKTNIQEDALNAGVMPGSRGWGEEPEGEWGLLHAEKEGRTFRERIPSQKGNYMEYYDAVYEALSSNATVPVTAEEGRDVIRIIQASFKSAEEKCVVPL